jgi:predicted metal-dependent HD superfamily phosphohydrolase
VYDVRREDNEAESALLAQERLRSLDVGSATVQRVATMIVATKTHETDDPETALFLDADLAILGADACSYEKYARNIRKEYAVFDDMTYRQGRKAVLRYFLQKPRIYLSDSFYNRYEEKARINLHRELDMLCAGS